MNGERRAAQGIRSVLLAALFGASLSVPAAAENRYDIEYPSVAYSTAPVDNPISRLMERLASGEAALEWRPGRGYLESLLEALEIDASSQVLVFSKTSLQAERIGPAAPRAVYFNESSYIGWVLGSDLIEIATVDPAIGPVFYLLFNSQAEGGRVEREDGACLTCHDTQGMMGGGVPLLMVRSLLVDEDGVSRRDDRAILTRDDTPFEQRWGGWYVTGRHGEEPHRGNIFLPDARVGYDIESLRRGNLDTLEGAGFFDTEPYLSTSSDIVALMMLEHQTSVQSQIAYVRFKSAFVLERTGHADLIDAEAWDALPAEAQETLARMMEELVRRLTLGGAIELAAPISGDPDYVAWYEAQGPRDGQGRSLHALDLETRLFERPLSPLIASEAFDGLPGFARDYVFGRIAAALEGTDEIYRDVSEEDRRALGEILAATKPEFAPYLAMGEG